MRTVRRSPNRLPIPFARSTLAVITAVGLLAATGGPVSAAERGDRGGAHGPGVLDTQVIARNGDGAIDPALGKNYRIVALTNLGGGVLLAAYDGRPTGADAPDPNSIVQRRSTDGGRTWGSPTFIARGQTATADRRAYGFSDPSYVVDRQTGTVFNFHVYSKDAGFGSSTLGSDDADRAVISAEVSVSTDQGRSWSTDPAHRTALPVSPSYPKGSTWSRFAGPLITSTVKPVGVTVGGVPNVGGVVGTFAASGEGIQLRYGPHRGRLLQQFAGTIVQPDGSRTIQAYSVYSDDHGASWHRGEAVGTAMDENKVVELSDGRVMLNSRDSAGGGGRKIAVSTDGGVTWGTVTYDSTLTDPRNNAGLTRMYPDAPRGSADARKLLFSNADNPPTDRINGTVRYSCDDGATWSTSRAFTPGMPTAYSTVTALGGGRWGLLYEGADNAITFASFDARWLGPLCGEVTAAPVAAPAGATSALRVSVVNRERRALPAGEMSVTLPAGWSAPAVRVPAVPAGRTTTVTVRVTAPTTAAVGAVRARAVLTTSAGHLDAAVPVSVTATR